jgi:internalin A
MKLNFTRVLTIVLCSFCLLGMTGPSCGYGEAVISDEKFDKTLASPTVTIEPKDGEVTLTWASVTNATAYNVYIEITSSKLGESTKKANVQSPQTIDGLTNGQKYYVAVQSIAADKRLSVISDKTINFTPNSMFLQMANKDITITDEQIETLGVLKELVGKQVSLTDKADNEAAFTALNALTSMDLTNKGIIDIKALQSFKKLTSLILDENEIQDISPLVDLDVLKTLSLSKTKISDISPVLDLEKLESLTIKFNNGDGDTVALDLGSFTSTKTQTEILKSFTTLILDDCNLEDLSGLTWLTLLTNLSLQDNNIKTLIKIQNFDKLMDLNVSGNLDLSADDPPYSNLRTAILGRNGTVKGPGAP